ncbi:MAG TPA: sigma-70 family RNA polymerase sigma factor, partial [Candidatus Acidoferrum sp.]
MSPWRSDAKKCEQRRLARNINCVSSFVLSMTLRESDLGLSRVRARAAGSTADSVCSEAENEVIGLFDEYRSRLLRYVLSIGLTVHHGEEIVQEVFLALFRHLRLGRPKDNLRGWIFRVAHNLALKERMSEQTRPDRAEFDEVAAAAQVDPEPNPEQHLAFRQRQSCLLAAV